MKISVSFVILHGIRINGAIRTLYSSKILVYGLDLHTHKWMISISEVYKCFKGKMRKVMMLLEKKS